MAPVRVGKRSASQSPAGRRLERPAKSVKREPVVKQEDSEEVGGSLQDIPEVKREDLEGAEESKGGELVVKQEDPASEDEDAQESATDSAGEASLSGSGDDEDEDEEDDLSSTWDDPDEEEEAIYDAFIRRGGIVPPRHAVDGMMGQDPQSIIWQVRHDAYAALTTGKRGFVEKWVRDVKSMRGRRLWEEEDVAAYEAATLLVGTVEGFLEIEEQGHLSRRWIAARQPTALGIGVPPPPQPAAAVPVRDGGRTFGAFRPLHGGLIAPLPPLPAVPGRSTHTCVPGDCRCGGRPLPGDMLVGPPAPQ